MSRFPTVPGFADPVTDAQTVFRVLLNALSRPGITVSLAMPPLPLPAPGMSQGMLAVALALCDRDTPLWLDDAINAPDICRHLRFHCASPLVSKAAEAAFAFIAHPQTMPRLREFNPGRAEFPDRSATLVINTTFSQAEERFLELTGPGVKGNERGVWQPFGASGLPAWFWEDWEDNHAAYPLGVDVVFVETGTTGTEQERIHVMGLPRTAKVRPISLRVKERAPCM